MAAITVDADDVRRVRSFQSYTGPAGEAIDAGEAVVIDGTTGKFMLADADTSGKNAVVGIALNSASQANITITVEVQAWLDLGNALASMDFGDQVFLIDTSGKLGDAAGTVEIVVGTVVPSWSQEGADKLLRVDL